MTEQQPRRGYRVDVEIDAGPDTVWRALRDKDELRRWFGWDYADIVPEIEFIFFTHADADDSARRLSLGNDSTIEVLPHDGRSIVRVVQAGPIEDGDWESVFDGEREGWRQFFHQLRHRLENGITGDRRTVRVSGTVGANDALDALERWLPGTAWDATPFQRTTVPGAGNVRLVNVVSEGTLASGDEAPIGVTLTTYDLDGDAFEALVEQARSWWASFAGADPKIER